MKTTSPFIAFVFGGLWLLPSSFALACSLVAEPLEVTLENADFVFIAQTSGDICNVLPVLFDEYPEVTDYDLAEVEVDVTHVYKGCLRDKEYILTELYSSCGFIPSTDEPQLIVGWRKSTPPFVDRIFLYSPSPLDQVSTAEIEQLLGEGVVVDSADLQCVAPATEGVEPAGPVSEEAAMEAAGSRWANEGGLSCLPPAVDDAGLTDVDAGNDAGFRSDAGNDAGNDAGSPNTVDAGPSGADEDAGSTDEDAGDSDVTEDGCSSQVSSSSAPPWMLLSLFFLPMFRRKNMKADADVKPRWRWHQRLRVRS